jgi:hypothetical protein
MLKLLISSYVIPNYIFSIVQTPYILSSVYQFESNSMGTSLSEKPGVVQLLHKFRTLNGIRRLITMFTRILISTSYLHLLLPNCLFPSGLPSKSSYSRVLVLLLATYPFHLIPFDLFISICLVWNMNYEVPNYVIFFSLFFLHPS